MPMDKAGKYRMNPHQVKMSDERGAKKGAEGSPKEEASEPMGEAMAEGDQGTDVTCPGCGATFPLELGLAPQQGMPGPGAVTTDESRAAAMPMPGGY